VAVLPEALFGQPVSIEGRTLKKIGVVFSLFLSLIVRLVVASNWSAILQYLLAASFGLSEPIPLPKWKNGRKWESGWKSGEAIN